MTCLSHRPSLARNRKRVFSSTPSSHSSSLWDLSVQQLVPLPAPLEWGPPGKGAPPGAGAREWVLGLTLWSHVISDEGAGCLWGLPSGQTPRPLGSDLPNTGGGQGEDGWGECFTQHQPLCLDYVGTLWARFPVAVVPGVWMSPCKETTRWHLLQTATGMVWLGPKEVEKKKKKRKKQKQPQGKEKKTGPLFGVGVKEKV